MAKSIKKFLKSFTLIELIIVIAVIAVLGASAFLVLSQWMSKSRDSRKIADLGTIDTAINISFTSNDKLPTPDNMTNIMFGGSKVWELGYFGDGVVSQIGGALTKTPSDPTTKTWYRYAQWNNKKYQLGTIVENEQFSDYFSRVYANEYFTRLQGSYNQSIIVTKIGTDDVIIPAPSLIVDEFTGTNYTLEDEYFWTNKNSYDLGQDQKNKLKVEPLFSGDVSDLTTPGVFNNFKTKFINTYSGTVYMKELTPDLNENEIEKIVSAELKKVSSQNVSVQYLSCDGISHGQTKSFYKESSVAFGESCDMHKKEFKCENGAWKDLEIKADLEVYKYLNCTVGPASNCAATTNPQKSTTNLDLIFNIPATEHGLGFNVEKNVNENNGTYKYSLGGNCNNGIFENITLGSPIVQSCDSGYVIQGNNCGENTYWTGDATNGFKFAKLGNIIYPKSCNDLLLSSSPTFKLGNTLPFNGTKFVDGVYWIKPDNIDPFKAYCDMTTDNGGWTLIGKGRQGWTWSDDGQGINSNILNINDLSVITYGTGVINAIRGKNWKDSIDGLRIHRVGLNQERRWKHSTAGAFTWSLMYNTTVNQILNGVSLGNQISNENRSSQGSTIPNNCTRIFLRGWVSHNYVMGWSSGSTCSSGGRQYSNESHVIPHTRVWVRN